MIEVYQIPKGKSHIINTELTGDSRYSCGIYISSRDKYLGFRFPSCKHCRRKLPRDVEVHLADIEYLSALPARLQEIWGIGGVLVRNSMDPAETTLTVTGTDNIARLVNNLSPR